MARKSNIHRDKVRFTLAERCKETRSALRSVLSDMKASFDEKMTASRKLQSRRRDESPSRGRRRCRVCGRPRGVYRKFGLCRIHLREAAMRGDVPGLVKASW